jgi:hypothetical protein
MCVFFKKGSDKITVLEIANREVVEQFADAECFGGHARRREKGGTRLVTTNRN